MKTGDSGENFALVVGATGISGRALCRELAERGWRVAGLSRRAPAAPLDGVETVRADLTDVESVRSALAGLDLTHVFFTAWSRMATEAENILVNSAMVRHVLDVTGPSGHVRHVALVTGLKHYLGPFEAYATGETRDTPFHEEEPRLPAPNFYYAQEDELWKAAERYRFTWSVHRSHTIIGHAVGNAMNMGTTLAVQAALCRAEGRPFVFPGNEVQWNGVTDMTDAGLLARQMIWAATTGDLPSQAYNTANGDLFRWRWMWPRIAELLDVEPEGYLARPRPLEEQMSGAADTWRRLAEREHLAEPDITRVASWWHTDSDLNRPIECFTDMTRSRSAGFTDYVHTLSSFANLFDTLRRDRVIPS
ncbi:nucleoside-diphosphate-sugar epimerase [Micromonospora pisi]|uniref:Nucleoside-diphosphate-sugar epimerase n=1 Tax=Micromonospora pisi TaxID=589240 RepID=A0A495JGW0_9ACTN|nr:SDR family oxidoreductase [Micromonospora pisi]RKR88270.1 nucleoside-diphosphate-sugar epimerase [Micromonospora pisi]